MQYILVKLSVKPTKLVIAHSLSNSSLYICEVTDEEALIYALRGVRVDKQARSLLKTPGRRFREFYGDAIFRIPCHDELLLDYHK